MADKQPVLEVRNLTVALPAGADRVNAVAKVSFTVNPGEIVCLVGESGSGKSVIAFTVMGLLAKALKPTSGEILLQGENILAASEARLRELRCTRMSMIFQEPMTALNPVMTCGEQIDEVLRTHTKLDPAARKAKILGILKRVQLPEPDRIYASFRTSSRAASASAWSIFAPLPEKIPDSRHLVLLDGIIHKSFRHVFLPVKISPCRNQEEKSASEILWDGLEFAG